ncbi:catalase [Phytomonospora endophytica]|uniref:Catalase n=1 Tax=Phytomonospora endophytica TaxID=714109 RepID=A0A841FVV5_9ACTN|nr:catalase [Phytomonospora endophytica]MBB6037868.1 catalase [Phytomonospora endophytica]GIG68767.1 catalase [Phytomonospora endophytica]
MGSAAQDRDRTAKDRQLDEVRVDPLQGALTTDQGVPVDDTDNSLTAGERGPSLLQDFHLREKITRFDHERIPERVVHARGSGAHGYFQVHESLEHLTSANFLCDPTLRTPVFVRFSTVQGGRGSNDTPRDVRGFAVKLYTQEGNFDLVGNNMPVFFIQDGIKFPDVVHAVKPEIHNEIPTGASAHDTFWDFVSLQPETMHHVIWLMSDRAIPRSFRMMQGFGVHTFRLVNGAGESTFVKFHWTPKLGTHSLVWDEAQKIGGKDPDFNRRDLWDAIEAGQYPEWELGIQVIPPEQEFDFPGVDLLDATKLVPEDLVPVTPVGRLVLDRNPDNFFAETEQVAYCVNNLVPGIDVTDDPMMQARMFSYLDTQLTRLGGPNFAQLPINRPLAPVANHQQDGFGQQSVRQGTANYHPNSIGGGCPVVPGSGAFTHFPQHVEGPKLRKRPESFADHFGQATLFWNSMSDWEKKHIVAAYRFELGKVTRKEIRERVVGLLNNVDHELAGLVAQGVGVTPPAEATVNHGATSAFLSQTVLPGEGIATRMVAVLVADGVDAAAVEAVTEALTAQGAVPEILAAVDGTVTTADGGSLPVTRSMTTMASVLYDAVVVPGGAASAEALVADGFARHFIAEAYKHAKPVAATGAGRSVLDAAGLPEAAPGLVAHDGDGAPPQDFVTGLVDAIAAHRHHDRDVDAIAA